MGIPDQASANGARLPHQDSSETTTPGRLSNINRKKHLIPLVLFSIFLVYFGLWQSDLATQALESDDPLSPSTLAITAPAPRHPCVSIVAPISGSEYTSRQNRLARILHDLGAEAYIAEPGGQTQFFTNFSSANWKLSERPLLVIITPQKGTGDEVTARVSLLTPKFEVARAKLLVLPSAPEYIEWAEEQDPYTVAVEALHLNSTQSLPASGRRLLIDNSARHFHYDGFQRALTGSAFTVASAPKEVNQLRERKSGAEIQIMKCVNEATLVGIRHVHRQMYLGMRESEARNMISATLAQGGLSDGGCLTLFGENAALPHGSGTNRALRVQDFALFDCTANLHGYWSDVTRTVALPSSKIPFDHSVKWWRVHLAQQGAISVAKNGTIARTVDGAARLVMRLGGVEQYFTHRLGHGIGLEVHEAPYLNGGSMDTIQTGHTFSNEPGIYIEGVVGIRLEDCFFINDKGEAEYLTAGSGGPSQSPHEP